MRRWDCKICGVCGKKKPLGEFYEDKLTQDGFCYQCKKCKSSYSKQYRQDKKEELKEYVCVD